jgi:uncharacterized iron-regulated protein
MVEGARVRADGALKEMLQAWSRARENWDDANAVAFGHRFIDGLEQAVRTALPALEKMQAALQRMQKDCEDPR